ncbi:fimbrial biogenesis outer membrane usher protein, partial [Escherichia coli]|nr:fimbrial biogenesis outer membrane usher protein [Escherichia coli]
FTIKDNNGVFIPFGAVVSSQNSKNAAIVGENGNVYLNGLNETGILNVKWGTKDNETCKVKYKLGKPNKLGLYLFSGKCI